MKKNNKKKKNIKLIIVIILVLVITILFILYKTVYLPNLIYKYRSSWDIFMSQNTNMSGEYMGKIYDDDYQITDLQVDFVSTVVADYYIDNTDDFFSEENKVDDKTYQKTISSEEMNKLTKTLFGPDYSIVVSDISYGNGRFLKTENNNYIIGSYDPDYCSIFNGGFSSYISKIDGYYKEKGNIIIKLKVGYSEEKRFDNDSEEIIVYSLYTNKYKSNLINSNYPQECVFGSITSDECYEGFVDYKVVLKKQSNGKYYFNSISKVG